KVRNYPNVQETSKIDSSEQHTEIAQPTLDEDCFFDFDIVDHTKRNSSKDATTAMEVDGKETVIEQLVINKQKFGHNNLERMEPESVNTIEGDEEAEIHETKHISYSEAADNRWAEDIKAGLIGLMKKKRNPFDCELWGYDKMIEAFENPEVLITLIKHNTATAPINKLAKTKIEEIEPEDLLVKRKDTLKKLKEVRTMLWTARNTENSNEQTAKIKYYTER
ncbi:8651_t:CDS:2, partial [Gigaspora rosea]